MVKDLRVSSTKNRPNQGITLTGAQPMRQRRAHMRLIRYIVNKRPYEIYSASNITLPLNHIGYIISRIMGNGSDSMFRYVGFEPTGRHFLEQDCNVYGRDIESSHELFQKQNYYHLTTNAEMQKKFGTELWRTGQSMRHVHLNFI